MTFKSLKINRSRKLQDYSLEENSHSLVIQSLLKLQNVPENRTVQIAISFIPNQNNKRRLSNTAMQILTGK